MRTRFHQLNQGWNAEPYFPNPIIDVQGGDVALRFSVNALQFTEFHEGETGILRFVDCRRYRLGPPNDDGWYGGQCRFSRLAPEWGEFYLIVGDASLLDMPQDWHILSPPNDNGRHFLFHFRENTFECTAKQCVIEPDADNALYRTGKQLPDIAPADLKPDPSIRRRLCRSQ